MWEGLEAMTTPWASELRLVEPCSAASASPVNVIPDLDGRKETILIVDDEPVVREILVAYLQRDGYRTLEAGDGDQATVLIEREEPNLVILDVVLPGLDGLEICRWIRSNSDLPVIIVSARGEEPDRILGLELGADDYVVKPFSPREIASRVRTILRRAGPRAVPDTRLCFAGLTVDAESREVTRDGDFVALTALEFDLLYFLARHPRHVFSREVLMDRIWGYQGAIDTGTVTVHMRRLREKIEVDPSDPQFLQTVWGVGYRFTP